MGRRPAGHHPLGSGKPLVVLLAVGAATAGAGAAAIWRTGEANSAADAGHRPASGATAVADGADSGRNGPALPVALSVPSAGLRAPVVRAGIDRAGAMALPEDVSRVGWYRYGPRPGSATGSAVLAGHVDSRERGLGVLASLRRVAPGDRLIVRLADGRDVTYRAVSREHIAKQAMPLGELFARAGPPRLTLITCGGPFNTHLRHYRDNLVITAVPRRAL